MEKIKKKLMLLLTIICSLILIINIIAFSTKKASEKYLKKEKIKSMINNIDFVDIFIKDNINSEQFNYIKDKLADSGIPVEALDEFIKSKPVEKYTEEIVSKSINNTVNGTKEKLVSKGQTYTFLEENIEKISEELQEKQVPYSDVLTEEKQQEILNNIEDKIPDIEEKINELQDRIYDVFDKYDEDLVTALKITRIIYKVFFDFVMMIIFIIFIIGIFITRSSFYKSLKWIGASFVISGLLLSINKFIYLDNEINKLPNTFVIYITKLLNSISKTLKDYGKTYIFIGLILILLNVIIYYILEKIDDRKYEKM